VSGVGAGVLVLLAVVGAAMVRASLRPLREIENTAAAIAQGDLARRVPEYEPGYEEPRTEVGHLARSLNTPIFPMRIGRLGCYFFSGSIVAAAWPVLKRRAMLAGALSLALFIVVVFEAPHTVICSLLLAGVVIGLGSSPLFSGFSKLGDASYGIYVFAWPIQQFSVLLVSGLWPSLLLAYCMTAAAGYTTWHLYEKRAIAARKTLAALIRQPLVYGAVRGPRRIERTTFDAS